MRSLLVVTFFSIFLISMPVKADLDLFVVEKGLENRTQMDTEGLLREAIRDLLIRLVGDQQVIYRPEAQRYLRNARQWVKSYRFINREMDGVVIGNKIRVEFDRNRLLAEFQQDQIIIWPLGNRPKTLLFGQWEQQGLKVNLHHDSLAYRLDLDYRDYADLLGLPVVLPNGDEDFERIVPQDWLRQPRLAEELIELWKPYGLDQVLIFKADVIAQTANLSWSLFSLQTGDLILTGEDLGEQFLPLLQDTFDQLLAHYSKPYREGAETLGLAWVRIDGLNDYSKLIHIERQLKALRPTLHDVKLARVNGDRVWFELVYQGAYGEMLRQIAKLDNVKWIEESMFSSEIKGQIE
jgi:hypothetical protein